MIKPTKIFLAVVFLASLGSEVNSVLAANSQQQVVASINGESISLAAVTKGIELELYKAEKEIYELRFDNLRSLLISKLIRLDPKSTGLSDNDYITQYVAKVFPVSEAEIEQFIVNQSIPQEKINYNLKQQVKRFLINQQIAQQVDRWFQAESRKHAVKISLAEPVEPRFDVAIGNAPVRGGKNAKVTIIEFSDFECPFCARANQTLNQLSKIYGDQIRLVYKHYPLPNHAGAPKAAEAVLCAQQQGQQYFWQLHDKLFETGSRFSVGELKDLASGLNLDSSAFNQCLNSGKNAALVEQDKAQGESLGVSSTPAFFINGRFLSGALPVEEFKEIIEQELKK